MAWISRVTFLSGGETEQSPDTARSTTTTRRGRGKGRLTGFWVHDEAMLTRSRMPSVSDRKTHRTSVSAPSTYRMNDVIRCHVQRVYSHIYGILMRSMNKQTKVLITTYSLCGTGLDGLKVANYCVHYGLSKDINEVAQATGRVDRQGQPITSHIHTFESKEQPLDQLTARMRDARDGLFGEDGLLGEIVALFGTGEEVAE
ncbi:uncharacterized protein CLUP02_16974 [Colletotrichum lupini]|uniref:Uncharacterized protein n=1 Tax=Colletotrichum lupini TaxID=145971 RepID=A0A9Q8T8U0_9PEZI|nr:uncharacterized protein CLUP02_16974 [Colletotrichum lupini]KAK1714015.1 hypothetical protein BDP67DRAFT_577764 [Colletotrichum lupini]UQC91439.1 hypothetical protein CLUP02_16974 [Colletotrichum lupini]